ncbi:YihY/virulence factor BrkB family protein [Arcobacter sp. CECT 8985]|uniref:YihY/virulence factor BrkB family protein n=1 Tax=Arcobacter sp. CECT 8985 TaxID=1935424 RepID=UPI00100BDD2D|nr:YihY/virulence factor BrkB family protein [Arcobacter sp. CECT 8985]RXJ83426.1 trehalose-6-phosphate synthase [Arcobacter sp. CECT 8985]
MKKQSLASKYYHNLIEFIDSFFNDDTTYYAASLSFFTIFSILPIIAFLIAIISTLDIFQAYIDTFVTYVFDILNPTHSKEFVKEFKSFLSNSNKLGYIGLFYMFFVFAMFFKDYEYIINKIHKAKRRPVYKSFFFYLIFLIAMPFIFTISDIIISLYSNSIINSITTFLIAWFIFFILFKLSVNKQVLNKAAAISSFVTLTILSVTKNLFVYYVIYNKTYSTIYGSLSTLLFSFFWIYISWIIFLYGIKMCHKLNTKEQR